jgi:hypothetical protein
LACPISLGTVDRASEKSVHRSPACLRMGYYGAS